MFQLAFFAAVNLITARPSFDGNPENFRDVLYEGSIQGQPNPDLDQLYQEMGMIYKLPDENGNLMYRQKAYLKPAETFPNFLFSLCSILRSIDNKHL